MEEGGGGSPSPLCCHRCSGARFVWHGQNVFNNFVNKMSEQEKKKMDSEGGLFVGLCLPQKMDCLIYFSLPFSYFFWAWSCGLQIVL